MAGTLVPGWSCRVQQPRWKDTDATPTGSGSPTVTTSQQAVDEGAGLEFWQQDR